MKISVQCRTGRQDTGDTLDRGKCLRDTGGRTITIEGNVFEPEFQALLKVLLPAFGAPPILQGLSTPLDLLLEWGRGCSNAGPDHPEGCRECTEALIAALQKRLE